MLPGSDRGNVEIARGFLIVLDRSDSRIRKLSNQQLLLAIKRAINEGNLTTDGIIVEARRILYQYYGDPDVAREIYIPMGGKN